MNVINPRYFFIEEENGKKYFLDKKHFNRKMIKIYIGKMKIKIGNFLKFKNG